MLFRRFWPTLLILTSAIPSSAAEPAYCDTFLKNFVFGPECTLNARKGTPACDSATQLRATPISIDSQGKIMNRGVFLPDPHEHNSHANGRTEIVPQLLQHYRFKTKDPTKRRLEGGEYVAYDGVYDGVYDVYTETVALKGYDRVVSVEYTSAKGPIYRDDVELTRTKVYLSYLAPESGDGPAICFPQHATLETRPYGYVNFRVSSVFDMKKCQEWLKSGSSTDSPLAFQCDDRARGNAVTDTNQRLAERSKQVSPAVKEQQDVGFPDISSRLSPPLVRLGE